MTVITASNAAVFLTLTIVTVSLLNWLGNQEIKKMGKNKRLEKTKDKLGNFNLLCKICFPKFHSLLGSSELVSPISQPIHLAYDGFNTIVKVQSMGQCVYMLGGTYLSE